jgi:HAD superfamily hydrolase (TIGR01509 family)
VLIDSEPLWEEVRRAFVVEHRGRWQPDSQRRMMGMSTGEWSSFMADELGVRLEPPRIAAAVIAQLADCYQGSLPLLPGACDAVSRTAERWRLGLASSSPRYLIDVVLRCAGLADLFAVTVSADEVSRGKPDPEIYRTAVRRLGVDPARCVAVEDSTNGLRSAHAAGLRLVAVQLTGYPPAADALAVATRVLDGLDQLTPALIDGLGAPP